MVKDAAPSYLAVKFRLANVREFLFMRQTVIGHVKQACILSLINFLILKLKKKGNTFTKIQR